MAGALLAGLAGGVIGVRLTLALADGAALLAALALAASPLFQIAGEVEA